MHTDAQLTGGRRWRWRQLQRREIGGTAVRSSSAAAQQRSSVPCSRAAWGQSSSSHCSNSFILWGCQCRVNASYPSSCAWLLLPSSSPASQPSSRIQQQSQSVTMALARSLPPPPSPDAEDASPNSVRIAVDRWPSHARGPWVDSPRLIVRRIARTAHTDEILVPEWCPKISHPRL